MEDRNASDTSPYSSVYHWLVLRHVPEASISGHTVNAVFTSGMSPYLVHELLRVLVI